MVIRLLDTGANDGFYNMALDEALFTSYKEYTTLRFYTFSFPTITIGRFQKIDEIKEIGKVDIVPRLTGGRAILHQGDLTYSLVFTEDNPLFGGLPTDGYKKVGLIFKEALSLLGIKAQFVRVKRSQYHKNLGCFSSASRYELQLEGKKILGSAQRRERGVVLQQGTLLVNSSPKNKDLRWSQVGLSEITGREIKKEEIISAIKKVLKNKGITIVEKDITPKEKELANKLTYKYKIATTTLQTYGGEVQ